MCVCVCVCVCGLYVVCLCSFSVLSIYHLLWVIVLFLDILKIDNLDQFKSLVKLQLDNNIIERIEGLGSLVHLEWLGML